MKMRAGFARHTGDGRELRVLRRELSKVTREKRAEGNPCFRGLAARYYDAGDPGTEYWLWDDMVERIQPGAFDRAISEAHDARGLFNHDSNQLLGRVSSGTCRLALSDEGLSYEIDEDPSDPDHQRVAAKIDRGDVTGSSFAFIARKVTWEDIRLDDGWLYVRNIQDVDLYDVGPVTWPAYDGTTAGRSSSGNLLEASSELSQLLSERARCLPTDDDVRMRMRMLEL